MGLSRLRYIYVWGVDIRKVLLIMQGLRTQESNEFNKFFEFVQFEAKKQEKVFFLDCEEGNGGIVDGLEVCNLSGWLIPNNQADEFEKKWKREEEDDNWADFVCLVRWKEENGLKLNFE